MKRVSGLSAVVGLAIPSMAWAQLPPGWQVCWGNACTAAVPLEPWMVVATGVLLLLAGLALLRRRLRGGLFLLAGVLAVGGYGLHDMKSADAIIADLVISTAAGSQTLTCAGPSLSVFNNSGSPVTLFMTPLNGANLSWLAGPGVCQQGGVLNSSASCVLPCGSAG